ncbi:MAG: hypothetical protein ACYDC6_10260 [Acidobacteriaceae bacterium]
MAAIRGFISSIRVTVMQLLYVLAMVAVFVLCVALLIAARRILRAFPPHSGGLGLQRHEAVALGTTDGVREGPNLKHSPLHEDEHALPIEVETGYAHAEPGVEPHSAMGNLLAPSAQVFVGTAEDASRTERINAQRDDDAERIRLCPPPNQAGRTQRRSKSSTPTYAYVLEVLLIAVSMVVLVRTQRSNSRYRVAASSRERVA